MLEVVAGGDFAFFVFPLSFSAERLGFLSAGDHL